MFTVYGKAGLIFSGSLEDLGKVEPISALTRLRRGMGARNAYSRFALTRSQAARGDAGTSKRSPLDAYAQSQSLDSHSQRLTRVADIMTETVFTLPQDASMAQAWTALANQAVGQSPVVDANGALVGLLLRADLMQPERLPGPQDLAQGWTDLLLQPVSEWMVTPVPAVDPDTDIRRLARVLLDTGLPGLPVMDAQEKIAGFVSRTDILRAVLADPPLDLWT